MAEFEPTSIAQPSTARDDPRVGHFLGDEVSTPLDARAVILGFPVDEGVRINGGRPGAAEAPELIRDMLYSLTPDPRLGEAFPRLLKRTVDLGNLKLEGSLEDSQDALGAAVQPYIANGVIPIIIGGGHETAFGHFLGYVKADRPVTIVNWDAHADVRPLRDGRPHSGSSFRQALEHPSKICQKYAVAGLLPHSLARAHLEYLHEEDAHVIWRSELSQHQINALYAGWKTPLMTTFDLDAVDQQAAPGVSAPAVGGLSPELWEHAAYRAGRCPGVQSMDVVECNPRIDVDGRTARLAALTVWHFLRGLAERIRHE